MSLYHHHSRIFLNYKTSWFIWEEEWDSFRPITSFSWTGSKFFLDDRAYCSDPSDEFYGYGNSQMKQACDLLTQKYKSKFIDIQDLNNIGIGPSQWFYDRNISLTPCAPKDISSWKRLVKGRYRTLRSSSRNKLTRRVL